MFQFLWYNYNKSSGKLDSSYQDWYVVSSNSKRRGAVTQYFLKSLGLFVSICVSLHFASITICVQNIKNTILQFINTILSVGNSAILSKIRQDWDQGWKKKKTANCILSCCYNTKALMTYCWNWNIANISQQHTLAGV